MPIFQLCLKMPYMKYKKLEDIFIVRRLISETVMLVCESENVDCIINLFIINCSLACPNGHHYFVGEVSSNVS